MEVEINALKAFLVYAKLNSYANENAKYSLTPLNTKRIEISRGEFLFIDEYAGENPFSGVETVFFTKRPVWQMHYYGFSFAKNYKEVYGFLRKALSNIDKSNPIRGKAGFSIGNWRYEIKIEGDVGNFFAVEEISREGIRMYLCRLVGGFVR